MSDKVSNSKKIPWNLGKRKPIQDDMGQYWCDCKFPKLTHNHGGRGNAICLLCKTPWYH